jgi:dTDP-4-dehydrorhamnose reductase
MGGSGLVGTAVINEMNKYNQFEVYSTYFQKPILLNQDRSFKLNIEDIPNLDIILRIPQVWGKSSARMRELLSSLHNRKDITVYPKLFCNTNTDEMIARQLCYIINNNLKGIFHLASEDVGNYKEFYNELIAGLGFENVRIEENFEEEGYFVLLSKRINEFPRQLRITNKSVINYLIS